jgi:hypothetical protein
MKATFQIKRVVILDSSFPYTEHKKSQGQISLALREKKKTTLSNG